MFSGFRVSPSGCSRIIDVKVESGLSWAEIAHRLETYPLTIRRWRYKGVRPNLAH